MPLAFDRYWNGVVTSVSPDSWLRATGRVGVNAWFRYDGVPPVSSVAGTDRRGVNGISL